MKNIFLDHILTDPKQADNFQKNMLEWYDHEKRDLPWRNNPSLYKTVISEFMLQQTRVSTVLPYFDKWLKDFPDFHTLANVSEVEVLKAWEGLGYYSRARNLHKLSKIATDWKTPPETTKEWMALPGVGPYIAAAVTSISMGKAEAVCDGNVVRVLSRIFAINEEYKDLFKSLVISSHKALIACLYDARYSILTVILAGFGRAISEVGAVIIVGGNIDHLTRVMTTTIALETSKGNLSLALALGIILLLIALIINLILISLKTRAKRRMYV